MSVLVYVAVIAAGVWLLCLRRISSPSKLNLPYVKFDRDNSASRYRVEYETILRKGYAQVSPLQQYFSSGLA